MLTEEALILIATLVATGLLALGVLDLVWPSTPRVPERRARVMPLPRSPFEQLLEPREEMPRRVPGTTATTPEPPVASAPAIAPEPPVAHAPPAEPVADPAPASPEAASCPPAADLVAPAADDAPPVAGADAAPGVGDDVLAAPAAPTPPRRERRVDVLPIETCVGMLDQGRYAEVVSLGSAALEVHAGLVGVSGRSDEAAALTALVGRAKQHLGDRDGARAAYGDALRAARPSRRSTHVGHIVELASAAVDAVPGAAAAVDAGAGAAQVRELLESAASVDAALEIVPGDASLERARAAVREALAIACEPLVRGLGAGEGGHEARALLLRALGDASMPAAWRERVGEQLTPISSAEIGQLTAQAIRCVQEGRDGDALEALERAEGLFAALPAGAVAAERLEEFERRLWWGYTKLGLSRVETGRFEDAVEPLLHALHLGGIDAERRDETRVALAGALDALVDERARTLTVSGAEGGAALEIDRLTALLRSAVERGLGESDLAEAFTKVQALRQTLSRTSAGA